MQKLELELQQKDKMIKGRQITWMVYQHFRLSDIDGAMNSWFDLLNVQLHGACVTCTVNQMTLKHGVEMTIKKYVPQIEKVISIE